MSLRVQRRIATTSVSQDGWPPSVQCSRADGGIAEVGQPPADAEGLQADGHGMKIRNSHAQGRGQIEAGNCNGTAAWNFGRRIPKNASPK